MAKQLEEGRLRSVWNSLFNEAELSSCKENDPDLQGVSMLLKTAFSVFEKLKERCEEAENVQRRPCQRCASLEKVIEAHEAKLKQTESRMKSIAQILNMGGLSQDLNASPGKQQSMAKALTQMLLCDDMAISEDESESDERNAKRKRGGTMTPIKVNVVVQKRTPVKDNAVKVGGVGQKRSPLKDSPVKVSLMAQKRSPVKDSPVKVSLVAQKRSPVKMLAPESLPVPNRVGAQHVVFETLCSQSTAPTDVVFLSDCEETFFDPPVATTTPTKRCVPQSQTRTSPVIKRRKSRTKHLNRSFNSSMITSSPPLSGGKGCKKSPFTPKLRVRRDIQTTPGDVIELVSTSESESTDKACKDMTPLYNRPNALLPLTTTPGDLDESLASPSLLGENNPLSSARPKPSDIGRMRSKGNVEIDNILDIMCDVPAKRTEEGSQENVPRKQADFWKLKPSSSSKEPISLVNGPKLKQTKISFGVHPERIDVCTLREFNGGVRQSQTPLDVTLREFNGGIRPSQTSTMLPLEMSPEYTDEEAFERAILDSLRETNTQLVPDEEEDEDFVAPTPDTSLSKRQVASQMAKERSRSEAVALKENARMVDADELLDEMGEPDTSCKTANLTVRTAKLIRDYDRVPNRADNEPDYKYKRDAVRKKAERRKLGGWDCNDCKKYYAARVDNSIERKELMDRCSKHRDKYKRNDTPPGYWNTEFPSTPELRARNLDVTQKAIKFHTRKRQ